MTSSDKWDGERRAVKAVQVAFDVGDEVNLLIRREALEQSINPSDRVRQILGLPISRKPVRPRLSISLSESDFEQLAEQFGLPLDDRLGIRRVAAEKLIDHLDHHAWGLDQRGFTFVGEGACRGRGFGD